MRIHNKIKKTVLAAFFLTLSYVMPFLTAHIAEIGAMLCPMHIPVLLCGFICGWTWGFAVGAVAPMFRTLILGMPPIFPSAVCMAFELAAYGAVAGLMHKMFPRKKQYIYCSLIVAMIVGRLAWGGAMYICMMASGKAFTLAAFLTGAVTNAIPGIVIQLIFIPILVMLLECRKARITEN